MSTDTDLRAQITDTTFLCADCALVETDELRRIAPILRRTQ